MGMSVRTGMRRTSGGEAAQSPGRFESFTGYTRLFGRRSQGGECDLAQGHFDLWGRIQNRQRPKSVAASTFLSQVKKKAVRILSMNALRSRLARAATRSPTTYLHDASVIYRETTSYPVWEQIGMGADRYGSGQVRERIGMGADSSVAAAATSNHRKFTASPRGCHFNVGAQRSGDSLDGKAGVVALCGSASLLRIFCTKHEAKTKKTLDPDLNFKSHIINITKTVFYQLRNIAKVQPHLFQGDTEKIMHAFITQLSGLPESAL
ncbi:hypothetical protein N1851_004958 [Merluccius polli]|uniref:Uncharacterized protein n=1 Tax=Merluccius polli TaxID=89951 RepID=A0AA47P6Y8_MERPO|nr:hypothetical protein N1851_004958 [Merluccius polli]